MKKTSLFFLCMIAVLVLKAQVPNRGCGTIVPDAHYDSLFQHQVINFLNTNSNLQRVQTTYQIPVIIHVIHGGQTVGTFPNLAQGQLNSQIQVLNDDYAGIGFNSGTYPASAFQSYASNTLIAAPSKDGAGRIGISNTGITFCLALKDSVGNMLSEPGIERMHWNTISGAADPTSFANSSTFMTHMNNTIKPATIWNPAKYLNIWISDVNASAGLLGFSVFPPLSGLSGVSGTGTATTDGLWCWAKIFGSQNIYSMGTYDPIYKFGRTATHELSHYFGIRHIWGDASCATDYCNDTPPQQNYTLGSATYPHLPNNCPTNSPPTGSEGIMFMNFADYTDDFAMYMFTDEQKARIQTAMLNSPYRKFLGTHGLCSASGPTVVANFSISPSVIAQGQSVSITDLSTTTSPPIFSWNYLSAASTVTSSTIQNPSFTFNTPGIHTISLTISSAGINASTTKTLQVNACPATTVNVTPVNASCAGSCNGSAMISANGGGPFTYSWTPSVSSSSVATGLCTGTYTCVITNSCGVSTTKIVNISTPSPLNVNVNGGGAPVCLGSGVNLSLSVSGGSPSYVYSWNTGSTLSSVSVTPAIMPITVYSVIVTDAQGCTASKSVTISVIQQPILSVSSPSTNVCFGYTMTATANGGSNYQWSTGSTNQSVVIQPFSSSVYSVVGTNSGMCSDTAFLSITVLPLPNVSASASSTLACIGQTISLNATGNATTYYWQPIGLFGPSQVVQVPGSTTYTLYGQSSNGCGNLNTVFVDVQSGNSVIPVVTPSVICAGDSAILTVVGGVVPFWSSNAVPNTSVVMPITNTSYTAHATDFNGCSSDIVFQVLINSDCDVMVYSGFTPNGDGINDYLVIDNIEKYSNNKVDVYNRWGNKIFSTTQYDNMNNHWDGKQNGKAVTSGTYFYIIETKDGIKKGWIELTGIK
jgi:gliding motility-associated-like protein